MATALPARPALVVFDCDGVLVDSERMELGTLAEALTWIGADFGAATLHETNRGGKLADLLALVEDEVGHPVPDWFEGRYRELQFERLAAVTTVPGARAAVETVVSAGMPRCVVSGGPIEKMEVSLRSTHLWDAFAPHIFSCYDIDDHKPSPGIYRYALDRFGVRPDDCIAIEDSENGVRAAAAAGVPVIGLARDTTSDALLAAGATGTVASMNEFAERLTATR